MRATKRQNEIIKAHFEAFESNTFRSDACNVPSLRLNGYTSRPLWEAIVEHYVSITSQLMMSNGTFKHISGKAKADIRKGFIKFLNRHNIK